VAESGWTDEGYAYDRSESSSFEALDTGSWKACIMPESENMPHVRMFAVATRPFPECVVAIRETRDDAEDEADRMNHSLTNGKHKDAFTVFSLLVHFQRDKR